MAAELESWNARIKEGVVEYSLLRPPVSAAAAKAQLEGLDGGDLLLPLAQGHGEISADGGDLADPQWSWERSPLSGDGGVIS